MTSDFSPLSEHELAQPATYFVSDTHLQEEQPEIAEAFCALLRDIRQHATALYLLGDLFEAWVGDDDRSPFNQSIIDELKLSAQQHPCYFIPGNRDILMGKRFYTMTGLQLLKDESVIDLYGEHCLLSHGDRYCLDDVAHQRYRRITQKKWLCRLVCLMPLAWRRRIAKKLRQQSHAHQSQLQASYLDVTAGAIITALEQHQCKMLIHGHTHQAKKHVVNSLGNRFVLGDWEGKNAVILRVTETERNLVTYRIIKE